jgi:uncharacterized protein DUF1707
MTAELPPASPSPGHTATPPLKASHADRDLAVDILRVAAGDGRLTAAELDERLDTALTAHTISELAALTADLPGGIMLRATCQAWASQNLPGVAPRWTLLQSLLDKPGGTNCWQADAAQRPPIARAEAPPLG